MDVGLLRHLLLEWQESGKIPVNTETTAWKYWNSWVHPRQLLEGDLEKEMTRIKPEETELGSVPLIREPEVLLLLEAFRGEQYHRVIQDLLVHLVPEASIVMLKQAAPMKCAVCGKPLLYFPAWSESLSDLPEFLQVSEKTYRSHLAIGGDGTYACVCTDCLVQLGYLQRLLELLDPGILNFRKRTPGGLKP